MITNDQIFKLTQSLQNAEYLDNLSKEFRKKELELSQWLENYIHAGFLRTPKEIHGYFGTAMILVALICWKLLCLEKPWYCPEKMN